MKIWEPARGKALIVGASGQVGTAMLHHLHTHVGPGAALPAARTPAPGSLTLDLAKLRTPQDAALLLDGLDLSAILCVAGWTWVDGNEDDPDRAFQINAHGPATLAAYAESRGLPFVYYSTDYLFSGSEDDPGPYTEDYPTHPVNVYGRSKLAGEQAVIAAASGAILLRTAGVYGADAQGKNFLYQVVRNLSAGRVMQVPFDQVSTPAYNVDLAGATFTLLQNGATGVYNACGPDVLGRLEFALLIASEFDLDSTLLEGISTAALQQRAIRPLRAGLDSTKLGTAFPEAHMRGVLDSIADCRDQVLSDLKLHVPHSAAA